jgi:phosphoribosylamine-glycine ligase
LEKVGVLVVSYGAREAAMVDALSRSTNYNVELYVADKQRNPFNIEKATKHVVISDLNVDAICKFAEANKARIDFAIVGPEKPIIEGVRDQIENRTDIPVICPKQEYAIEVSKVQQRLLFEEITPDANPLFKVFDPKDFKGTEEAKQAVYGWLDELGNQAVVKRRKSMGRNLVSWLSATVNILLFCPTHEIISALSTMIRDQTLGAWAATKAKLISCHS